MDKGYRWPLRDPRVCPRRLFSLHVPIPPKVFLSLVYKLEGSTGVTVALELTMGDSSCHVGGISVLTGEGMWGPWQVQGRVRSGPGDVGGAAVAAVGGGILPGWSLNSTGSLSAMPACAASCRPHPKREQVVGSQPVAVASGTRAFSLSSSS